ncbi:hypothetical protein PIB30_023262 [Stylosanthes scabra]|uniref:MADS-box domain-containing protein n=1 Tax=Stylosanthes scabra TaxID=79078 RepID=A0ABU6Y856_9FABA|nr:hypothetical protein [Stylosanthes scabra]
MRLRQNQHLPPAAPNRRQINNVLDQQQHRVIDVGLDEETLVIYPKLLYLETKLKKHDTTAAVTQQCQKLLQAEEFEIAQGWFSNNEGVRAIQSQVINNIKNEDVIVKTINKRRVKLQLIIDPSSRRTTFKKRRAGDTKPTVWPSMEEASQIMQKFEEVPRWSGSTEL